MTRYSSTLPPVDCGRWATRGTGRAVSTAEHAPRGAMTGVPGSAGSGRCWTMRPDGRSGGAGRRLREAARSAPSPDARSTGSRGVLVQREVSARPMIVGEVSGQEAAEVSFAQHDHVIEALAAEGADESFDVRILPGAPRRGHDFADPQALDAAAENACAVDRVAIAQEVARGGVVQGKASTSCWAVHAAVGCSVTLKWTTRRRSCARTTKTKRTLNGSGGHGEEVDGDQAPEVVVEERAPGLRRRASDGGPRTWTPSPAEISMPSFWSSRVSRVTLTCSAGGSPAGARASSPVAWMAG